MWHATCEVDVYVEKECHENIFSVSYDTRVLSTCGSPTCGTLVI